MTKLPTKTLALLIEQLTMERHANAAYSAIAALYLFDHEIGELAEKE